MPSSCLCQWAHTHQRHCIGSSHQHPVLCSSSVWQHGKQNRHMNILWRIPLSPFFASDFNSQMAVFTAMVSAILPVFFRALLTLNHARFSCTASPTCSFYHQVSGVHWCFLMSLHTSMAASSRGHNRFDQADSIWFTISATTPTALAIAATVAIVFQIEGQLKLASSSSVPALPGVDVSRKVTNYCNNPVCWWRLSDCHMLDCL